MYMIKYDFVYSIIQSDVVSGIMHAFTGTVQTGAIINGCNHVVATISR